MCTHIACLLLPPPGDEGLADGQVPVQGGTFFKDLLRYPLAREGVYNPRQASLPNSYIR